MLWLYVLIQSSLFIEFINLGNITSKSCLLTGEMKERVPVRGLLLAGGKGRGRTQSRLLQGQS